MRNILERMKETPLLFDGAMGTMIYERGVFINTCYDELCLSNPRLISQIHREYVEAGADVIETNTFGANRIMLRPYGLADKAEAINRQAVRVAREGAGGSGDVAAAAGPWPRAVPVLASFVRNERGETAVGTRAETMARTLSAHENVDLVGINCGVGPAGGFDAPPAVLPGATQPGAVRRDAGDSRER